MEYIIPVFALLISISGFSWTVWYNLKKTSNEKTARTIDLHVLFSQTNMVNEREVAWQLLDSAEETKEAKLTFKSLWDNNDKQARENFRSLYKVLSFWLTICELGNAEKLDKELAVRFFTYEYEWWFWRMKKLVEDTPEAEYPDVFQPFIEKGFGWMPRNNEHESEPRSRKVRTK